jgi:uncharacterized protein (TIGR02217 family)
MITPDTSPIFPGCPSFGFTAEPEYLVKITAREGGYERRDRKWARPLIKFTGVPLGDQPQADIEQVLYFWHAMGGMSSPFRFQDWTDYKSCGLDAEPAATDQPIVATLDTPPKLRLVKQYVVGSIIQQREILRPLGSSLSIANEGGAVQPASSWTVDESTGLLTIGTGFSGTPTAWGGEFFCWVRFNAQLNPQVSNYQIQNVTVQLAELRVPLP